MPSFTSGKQVMNWGHQCGKGRHKLNIMHIIDTLGIN